MTELTASLPTKSLERLFAVVHADKVQAFAGVPGPPPIFPLGNALELAQGDLHKLFERYRETYGDYVVFWILGQPSLLINKPELIAEILVGREDDYYKNVPRAATEPVMGSSVFRSEGGKDWAVKRAGHPFEARGVERWYEQIVPTVSSVVRDHMLHLVPANAPADVTFFDELYRMSFQVFANTVLGAPLTGQDFDDHAAMLHEIGVRGGMPVPVSVNPMFWLRRRRWLTMIEERLRKPAPDAAAQAPSLIAFFKSASHHVSSEKHLRDEISNVFSAGMKNVGIAAAAVLFVLSRYPAVREKVLAELDAAVAEHGANLGLAAIDGMAYFDRVVKEALRLYPVVPGFVRQVKPGRAVILGGRRLPDTTQIFITSWTMHRDPDLWPEPLRFDPDRWSTEPPPHRYLPFGLGARSCVGERFTLVCTKVMVTRILGAYTVDVDPSCTFDTTMTSGTAPPKDGMPARITARPRRGAAHAPPAV